MLLYILLVSFLYISDIIMLLFFKSHCIYSLLSFLRINKRLIVSLTIEINKNSINTSKVADKKYHKIILFWKLLSNETDNSRELLTFSREMAPENTCLSLSLSLSLSFSLSLYTVDIFIIFCYDHKHLLFSNKPYQPEMNFIQNKYLPGLLMLCPGSFHATV